MTLNLMEVTYAQTGKSQQSDALGMREMQARVYAARDQQYLLIKAPPASGKSRALMFLGLDKMLNQGLKKVIVAVPERSIGKSFLDTDLTSYGFFEDWKVARHNNLCTQGTDGASGKIKTFKAFMASQPDDIANRILICTHATLRYAFNQLHISQFNNILLALDEFHHVSADADNQLGNLLAQVMQHSTAHIAAMTGSYFRGDTVPILEPEDEARFAKVTYTYYEQLNGYNYLKSLGIGYHFYQGRFLDAVHKVLDPKKKTIVHIPNVNSRESTKDKYGETDAIVDALGEVEYRETDSGILIVRAESGKYLRVADLVTDTPERYKVIQYLQSADRREDVDVIIALGMAKEGFDWPWCEHVLTIGYRNSMTEVVQIIGRATRDAPDKHHAQFTNLIAQPDAEDEDVKFAVNNMLKAITVSLLMEQVMAPSFNFRPRTDNEKTDDYGSIEVEGVGGKKPTPEVQNALDNSDDIVAAFLQKDESQKAAVGGTDSEVLTQEGGILDQVIQQQHPELGQEEVDQVRKGVATQLALNASGGLYAREEIPDGATTIDTKEDANKAACIDQTSKDDELNDNTGKEDSSNESSSTTTPDPKIIAGKAADDQAEAQGVGNKQFIKLGDKFVNIEALNMDLIESVNPFQGAFEVLSKSVTPKVLKTIQDNVQGSRVAMSEEEALILWPKIRAFYKNYGREPSITALDPVEKRYAECLAWVKQQKARAQINRGE